MWCSRSSVWKHSTSTSTRAWALTACSTRTTSRRCPTGSSGLASVAFAGALAVGVYLTVRDGWPILVFALLGGTAAIFYVAPPVRWAYRGLGETVIALSYGPWMVLGSLYLHTRTVSWGALWASLVPGFLIMALAVVNAIPDFHQDRLVGKRNLVVRLGRRRAVVALSGARRRRIVVVLVGVIAGEFPKRAWRRSWRCRSSSSSARRAVHTFESPRRFVPAIRSIVGCYLVAVALFTAGVLSPALALSASPCLPDRQLKAPLFVSWQLTRDCDLSCVHCCTGSAPGKRLPDELDAEEALRIAEELIRNEVPYVMLCGGEPLVVPHFLALARPAGPCRRPAEDRDQRPAARCAAPRRARPASPCARCRSASMPTAGGLPAPAARRLAGEGPRGLPHGPRRRRAARSDLRAHAHQHSRSPGRHRPRARLLGAFRFNTGQLMRIGTAARLWEKTGAEPRSNTGSSTSSSSRNRGVLRKRPHGTLLHSLLNGGWAAREPAGASGDAARAAQRLGEGCGGAAAICADLRTPYAGEAWTRYRAAWQDGQVIAAVERAIADESRHAEANAWQVRRGCRALHEETLMSESSLKMETAELGHSDSHRCC